MEVEIRRSPWWRDTLTHKSQLWAVSQLLARTMHRAPCLGTRPRISVTPMGGQRFTRPHTKFMPGGNGPGGLDVGSTLPGIPRAPFLCTNSSPTHCPPALATIWAAEMWGTPSPQPPRRRAVLLAEPGMHSPGRLWKTRMPRWGAGSGPQEGPCGGRVSLPPGSLSRSWLSAGVGVGVAGLRQGGEGFWAHGGAVGAATSQASLLSVTRLSSASLHCR